MAGEFDWEFRTRLVFGAGTVDRLGALACELGAARAFLVTDPGLVAAGHADRAEHALRAADIEVRRFDGVTENPTGRDVEACLAALGGFDAHLLVGLGGGSSIDVAKGCALLRAGGGRMEDYRGRGQAKGTLLPLLAVPTTAGTGTETQSFALIGDASTHEKLACGDPQLAPRIAVLDPALTVTMPRFVTACTGMDALGHALETAVTRIRNPISALHSKEAFRLIVASFPRVLERPDDLEARGRMLLAAAFAGIAIESSMLGAAHSMANPLTACHGLAHGQAVGICLPPVIRFNAHVAPAAAIYADLARSAGLCDAAAKDSEGVEALIATVERLLDLTGFGRSLAACGVPRNSARKLADDAARQWTAHFNPRPVSASDFVTLFEQAGCPGGVP